MSIIQVGTPAPDPTPQTTTRPNLQTQGSVTPPIFTNDLEHKWKDLPFPAAAFRVRLRQDVAIHKYSEKDGAEVEMVGMDALEFECRIPFLNSVLPGNQETWTPGQQYPQNLKAFIAKFADKSPGKLQHPFLGTIRCVLHDLDVDWTAATQDGTWATARWISTLEVNQADQDKFTKLLGDASPISKAIGASAELDSLITSMNPPLPNTPVYQPNFADTMRQIQGIFDTATQLSARVAGTINAVNYRVNAISDAINNAKTSFTTLANSRETGSVGAGTLSFGVGSSAPPLTPAQLKVQSVLNVRARIVIDQLRVAMAQLKLTLAAGGRPIALFVSAAPSTLDGLSLEIAQSAGIAQPSMTDLMALNGPAIVAQPILPAGTRVRYFLQSPPSVRI